MFKCNKRLETPINLPGNKVNLLFGAGKLNNVFFFHLFIKYLKIIIVFFFGQ